ncbi:MAG TPA: hypothetical protein VKE94_00380 [Gemmataceae bacterium]|nr:hypothetical protein [Gemmataceae bacterium]
MYNALDHVLVWLYARWNMYRQVFGTSENRINLLNELAPAFFKVCQDAIWADIRMELCRLADPAETCGKPNLTLQRLVKLIDPGKHPTVAAEAAALLQEVEQRCVSFREWRNRRGGHRDLDTALERHARPLPGASREMIEDALQCIRDLMNALLGYFDNGAQKYFPGLDPLGNGDALIACLEHTRAHREKLRASWGMP